MSTLQVHITAGPQAGARLQLNQPPVSFGRSADNALVIDAPVVSRQHGELTIDEDGQWVLNNFSQNTTRVGRKKATKKPVPLTDGASITIGDTEVFRVYLTQQAADQAPAADAASADADTPPDHAPGAGLRGKSKLWIGIGLWLLFLLGVSVFFLTSDSGDEEPDNTAGFYKPGNEIADMSGPRAGEQSIKNRLKTALPWNDPNELRYNAHVTDARAAADAGKSSLYQAYRHYQQAISYASRQDKTNPVDSLTSTEDKLKYNRVLDELAKIIYERYIEAYRRYQKGDYDQARDILDDLRRDFYPGDPRGDDPLAADIRKLRNAAHARAGG